MQDYKDYYESEFAAIEKVLQIAKHIAVNRDHLQMPNLGGMTRAINVMADAISELDEIRRKEYQTKGDKMKVQIKNVFGSKIEYDGGVIVSVISKKSGKFMITTQALTNKRREVLLDFALALRTTINHVGKITGHNVKLTGTPVDPDEHADGATIQIFPKDKRYVITFNRDAETGYVKAVVPNFKFTDMASAAQLAFVCAQAAALMKAYENI